MKNLKLKTVIIPILIIAVVGGASYITITNKIKKENALKIVQLNEQKAYEKKAADKKAADAKALADAEEKAIADAKALENKFTKDDNFDTDVVAEERVYIRMHGMINTKITAEDGRTWGLIPITTEGCNEMIRIVKLNNYADKEKLLLFLNSWIKKDFSDGVEQHNYIWGKLGGVEGKATALKKASS